VIIVDTNVVSELLRPAPEERVRSWVRNRSRRTLVITAITVAELLRGIDQLPKGRRRTKLEDGVDGLLTVFDDQVLPFDNDAAFAYADVVDERLRAGRPIDDADAQIASICRSRRVPLATRNTRDFELTGIDLIDPWAGETVR